MEELLRTTRENRVTKDFMVKLSRCQRTIVYVFMPACRAKELMSIWHSSCINGSKQAEGKLIG